MRSIQSATRVSPRAPSGLKKVPACIPTTTESANHPSHGRTPCVVCGAGGDVTGVAVAMADLLLGAIPTVRTVRLGEGSALGKHLCDKRVNVLLSGARTRRRRGG